MPSRRPKKAKPSTLELVDPSTIVKQLKKHISNRPNKRYYQANHMDDSQVRAALGLLRKAMPDLAAHKMDISGDVKIEVLQVADHKAAK